MAEATAASGSAPDDVDQAIVEPLDEARPEIRKLVPWPLRARRKVLIAEAALEPGLVLTIEPLDTVLEQEFISTVGRLLTEA